MPLFSTWLLFNSENYLDGFYTSEEHKRIYAVFFITTVVMPGISFYILKYNKLVSSFSMPYRQERFIPYLTTLVYYGVLYYLLRANKFPWVFLSALLGSIVVLCIIMLLNTRFKISAHAAGIAGVTAIYGVLIKHHWVFNGVNIFVALLVLCGLVCTARLSLQAHRNNEIYWGLAVGFGVEFLMMNYKWYI